MRFGGKPARDIDPDEIQAMVHSHEPEDEHTDFKEKPYGRDPKGKGNEELCKDVSALANSGGGYLFIGIAEMKGKHRADHVLDAPNAEEEVSRMLQVLADGIEPRVPRLQVLPRSLPDGKTIIVCAVPDSPAGPHMVGRGQQTWFCLRHGHHTRAMRYQDIRQRFLGDAVLLAIKEVGGRVAALEARDAVAPAEPQPDEDALAEGTTERQVAIMRSRFEAAAGDTPFFMCSIWPAAFRRQAVDVDSQEIDSRFRHPPRTREAGFVIYDLPDVRPTQEGLLGQGDGGRELTLLRSGYLEYRQHALESFFQWMQPDEMKATQPWLYPYAVCELPVCFFRLADAVYTAGGVTGPFQAFLAYRNISGFILLPGHPTSAGFYHAQSDPDIRPYRGPHMPIGPHDVTFEQGPDAVAYEFVRRVYGGFGLSRDMIPFFAEDGGFDESTL